MRIGPSGNGYEPLRLSADAPRPERPPEAEARARAETSAAPAADPDAAPSPRFPALTDPDAVARLRGRLLLAPGGTGQEGAATPEAPLAGRARRALDAYRDTAHSAVRDELERLLGVDLYA